MKLTHVLLHEQKSQPNIFEKIRSQCSDFLDTGVPLFRGMSREVMGEQPIRTDRRALHSNVTSTSIFNLLLEYKTKEPTIRSRSMYCSTSVAETTRYGSPHYIFPVNGTHVLYNPGVHDSIMVMSNLVKNVEANFSDLYDNKPPKHLQIAQHEIDLLFKSHGGNVTITDLEMLSASTEAAFTRALQTEAVQNPYISGYKKSEIGSLQPHNSGHHGMELMLFGVPKAYVVSRNKLVKMLSDDLGPEADLEAFLDTSNETDPLYDYILELIEGF